MKLSTKTRYGTRALLDLAIHQKGNAPIPLRDIAERQEISLTYLEHIITPLIATGIISTVRGVRGGITLAKATHNITLKEVVDVLEGPITPVECLTSPQTCHRSSSCATRDIWDDVKRAVDRVLISTTLQDLVDKQTSKNTSAEMYFI
jgi:Rrf2 family transcriptional regulator, cysteine metabolism repressor